MHERRLRAGAAASFQKVQGTDRVRIEIIERNSGCAIVTGLAGRVDQSVRPYRLKQGENAGSVADIQLVMFEVRKVRLESMLIPTRVALGAKEDGALVVVQSMDGPPLIGKEGTHFGAD
jgi:hypothetical protein